MKVELGEFTNVLELSDARLLVLLRVVSSLSIFSMP